MTGPTHAASFSLNADGSFAYTPAAGYTGPDAFTYTVNNGTATSSAATVNLTVTSTVAVAQPDSYSTGAGIPLTVPPPACWPTTPGCPRRPP